MTLCFFVRTQTRMHTHAHTRTHARSQARVQQAGVGCEDGCKEAGCLLHSHVYEVKCRCLLKTTVLRVRVRVYFCLGETGNL